ncbi:MULTISPECIES: hypothetical protein [unclassified Streptomyces]|uniref:hypothetical protein n=1 Tax=Streptomycetaceae TaxID=2062 RepID=UPI002E76EA6B|nr:MULTISPECIES: hypothetical protein [unclassified Streptomyces]MED7955133.1 hypothetical protein [Streptomyces sp. BE303]MEE1824908.1 hypothetical protein [Streptomyces sp. BE20]
MNRLNHPLRTTVRLLARIRSAVERLDARADAALRAWARPLTARTAELLRRMAAANCSDALSRHLPCRARERAARDAAAGHDGRPGS